MPIASGDMLAKVLCAEWGLPAEKVRRIVIDVKPWEPLMIYVELYGGQEVITLDWSAALKDTKVMFGSPITDEVSK